ncbi:HNH endonuclease family protein [Bounagaea algeriensis]
MRKRAATAATALPLAAALGLSLAQPAASEPPGIPTPEESRGMLAELRTAPEGPMDGYDRDKFPHWNEGPDNCNTREQVLRRDGDNVETGDDCYPTSGTWTSPYDGQTWSEASDVDIDHVVPLAAAWRSGAAEWTNERRSEFANDLESPQLVAVTDSVNQEKGDSTPDEWMPPENGYHCTYASMWIASKHKWQLTITDSEQTALENALSTC